MLLVSGYCVGQEGFLFSNAKPVQSVKLSVGNVRAGLCSSNLKLLNISTKNFREAVVVHGI